MKGSSHVRLQKCLVDAGDVHFPILPAIDVPSAHPCKFYDQVQHNRVIQSRGSSMNPALMLLGVLSHA